MDKQNIKPKKIAVTNRHLCYAYFVEKGLSNEDADPCDCLLQLLETLAKASDYDAILLREKDMSEEDYAKLAHSVSNICRANGKALILHKFPDVAKALGCPVHLPFSVFSSMQNGTSTPAADTDNLNDTSTSVGTSVHSIEDAVYAELHGASYVIAGHIFETDCKKGLQGRGLNWLASICQAISVPVYAIGGMTEENAESVFACGAAGYCMMSHILHYAK